MPFLPDYRQHEGLQKVNLKLDKGTKKTRARYKECG